MYKIKNLSQHLFTEGRADWFIFIPFFFLGLYLSNDINFVHRAGGGLPEITSDKADYYIYLPATFIYKWDIHKIPRKFESRSPGIHFDYSRNKILTKTTCGVAIMWAPFFLITNFIATHWDPYPDGFSLFYERMTIFPEVFYLILGLFFLRRFLSRYFSRTVSYITVILLFAGTNLYYYGIDEGLMSHVNSFFLFCLFLFLLKKFLDSEKKQYGLIVGISFVFALAVLIRPTSIILLTWIGFLDVKSFNDFKDRLRLFLKPLYIITFLIAGFIIFLPQFIYWKYLTDHFFYYSYNNETFTHWKNPQIFSVWFAPLNGFFLYTPLALFFMVGIIQMIKKKLMNGIFIGIFFIFISYLFSSWCCWYFGGSFGYRPFVEFYALLAIPFAWFIGTIPKMKNLYIRMMIMLLIIASVWYNLKLTYGQRWYTGSTWSWDDYLLYLDYAGLYNSPRTNYLFKKDFENNALERINTQTKYYRSPTQGGVIDKNENFTTFFKRDLSTIIKTPVSKITASLWIYPEGMKKTGLIFFVNLTDWQNKSYFYKKFFVDDFIKEPNQWAKVYGTIEIPDTLNQQGLICKVALWNDKKQSDVYFDDLKLLFE
ncbi:MAG: hypothetical protein ABSD71_03105 [Bacteroidales bacterium]